MVSAGGFVIKENFSENSIRGEIAESFARFLIPFFTVALIINAAVIFMPPVQPTRLFVVSISTPGIIIALYFAFRKKFIKSVYSFIIMVAVALIAGAFLNGGVRAPAFIGLLVPLVYLGWICRSRNMVIFLGLYFVLGIVLATLDNMNILPYRLEYTSMRLFFVYASYILAIAVAIINGNKMLHGALQQREEKTTLLDSIFTSIADAIFVLDQNYRVIQMNRNAENILNELGYKNCEFFLEDIRFMDMESEKFSLKDYLTIRKNFIENKQLRYEGDDHTCWFHISGSPFLMGKNMQGAVLSMRNNTLQVEQERQLVQSQKMDALGQLAGGITHDFNNILAGIQGAAEATRLKARDDQVRMIELIIDSVKRASELVDKLLVFTRKTSDSSKALDVHRIISDTYSLLERTIDRKINIVLKLNSERSITVGDNTQIQSALMNMGINASQAMPDGGTLTFETSNKYLNEIFCKHSQFDIVPGNYILIRIIDTGHGMDDKVKKHIFEPFYTTKDVGKGTGLGLAAVYGMVQRHKGAISVYSEVGLGTTFHIYLPLAEEDNEEVIPVSKEEPTGTGIILIVDDDKFIRITTEQTLISLGYTVYSFEEGRQALEFIARESADVILLDMIMPVMNGRELYDEILKTGFTGKVILTSGLSKKKDVAAMEKKGLFGFLHKPFDRSELARMVFRALTSGNKTSPAHGNNTPEC